MKRLISLFLFIISIITLSTVCYGASETDNHITFSETATDSSMLLFAKKFGGNYKGAPTPPIVVNDTLIVVSGVKIYKLDAVTGEEIASTKMQGSTIYATVSPCFAEGKIFVQLDGGIVQAFDYETMTSQWIYTAPSGGQAICPVTYKDGYIYTGFWNGETEVADYVALSTADEDTTTDIETKTAQWTYSSSGGFYWAGCAVTDNYVVFGKDDGERGYTGTSHIIALDKTTGQEVSYLIVTGDIRSSVTYSEETDAFYCSGKAGYIYKFRLDESTGKLYALEEYKADGAVTSTPVVYNKRLYAGCQKGAFGKFIVLDAETINEIYSCDMQGYPQGTMLVSAGYENTKEKVYIYSTYNAKPGGITVFEDSKGQTTAKKTELFVPDGSMSEYCISTISAGEDGILFYKNDSGNIFAVIKEFDVTSLLTKIFSLFRSIIEKLTLFFS